VTPGSFVANASTSAKVIVRKRLAEVADVDVLPDDRFTGRRDERKLAGGGPAGSGVTALR
jgi:hypothetical protein